MDADLQALGISASADGPVVALKSVSNNITTYSASTVLPLVMTATIGATLNGTESATIGGTATVGDVVTITVNDAALTGGQKSISRTVITGDTPISIASALAASINSDVDLQAINVTAISASNVVSMRSSSANATTYTSSTSAAATATILIEPNVNGVQVAAIGGTPAPGNIITLTIYDAGLAAGSVAVSDTVAAGGATSTIATNLAAAVNADSSLQSIGVQASASQNIVSLRSVSTHLTSYASSVSGGSTTTIALAPSTNVQKAFHNNLNELTSTTFGGATRFQGTTNKAITSASINSTPAMLDSSKQFTGGPVLNNGNNSAQVEATDAQPVTKNIAVQLAVKGPSAQNFTFDSNGNMTGDGTKTFAWDAENRLIKITYPGTNNRSEFTFDPLGRNAKIVEITAGTTTSTKQFVWHATERSEERDASGAIVQQHFALGNRQGLIDYHYSKDHLGSNREITNDTGTIQTQYSYGPLGERTKIAGSGPDANFGFAGMYHHARSGLDLTVFRPYSSSLGRWLRRDPLGESAGTNLYAYVDNNPVSLVDPLGTLGVAPGAKFANTSSLAGGAGGFTPSGPVGMSGWDFGGLGGLGGVGGMLGGGIGRTLGGSSGLFKQTPCNALRMVNLRNLLPTETPSKSALRL